MSRIPTGLLGRAIQSNFELRTIRVVTLCSLEIRQPIAETAVGELCATTQLVSLLQHETPRRLATLTATENFLGRAHFGW